MLVQTSRPDEMTSLPLHVETARTDEVAASRDVASRRSARLLWTGLGFAVLMLIGVSACAPHVLPPHASAAPSRLASEIAFGPMLVLDHRGTFLADSPHPAIDDDDDDDDDSPAFRSAVRPGGSQAAYVPVMTQASERRPVDSGVNLDVAAGELAQHSLLPVDLARAEGLSALASSATAEMFARGPEAAKQMVDMVENQLAARSLPQVSAFEMANICSCASISSRLLNAALTSGGSFQPRTSLARRLLAERSATTDIVDSDIDGGNDKRNGDLLVTSRGRVLAMAISAAAVALSEPAFASYAMYQASYDSYTDRKKDPNFKPVATNDRASLAEIQQDIEQKRGAAYTKRKKKAPQYCAGQTSSVTPMLENICANIGLSKADQTNRVIEEAEIAAGRPLSNMDIRPK